MARNNKLWKGDLVDPTSWCVCGHKCTSATRTHSTWGTDIALSCSRIGVTVLVCRRPGLWCPSSGGPPRGRGPDRSLLGTPSFNELLMHYRETGTGGTTVYQADYPGTKSPAVSCREDRCPRHSGQTCHKVAIRGCNQNLILCEPWRGYAMGQSGESPRRQIQ